MMFFQETRDEFSADVAVPAVFFDQILPILHPNYARVYLYGYYLTTRGEEREMDNQVFAAKLKIELAELLEAWDFLESCGLIRKHLSEEALAWDYAVEFCDLKAIYRGRSEPKHTVSTDEMVVLAKNSYQRAMFDAIESMTKKTLSYNDIRTINEFMKEYSVSRELVTEAFSFSVSMKKSRTVASALGILRTWYLDGIRSVEDVQLHLQSKHQRYTEYRKILSFLGEYRLPTGPEKKMMDHWLDEMQFGMEVIESAVGKSVAIKNPNMNYVNGVLKNWHKKYTALPKKRSFAKANKFSELEFRTRVIEALGAREKTISQEEDRYLTDLYRNFSFDEVETAIRYLKSSAGEGADAGRYRLEGVSEEVVGIEALARFLIRPGASGESADSKVGSKAQDRIHLEDIADILSEKAPKTAAATSGQKKAEEEDELERRLIRKRETINKQAELNQGEQ